MNVPQAVMNRAVAVGAQEWLAGLDALVESLERDWAIEVDHVFTNASEAFVAEVRTEDGTAAVLKVMVPRATGVVEREIAVLRLADGDGCASLLRVDTARGALLLERLGPSLADLALPMVQRHDIMCEAASRLWRATDDRRFPTGAEKAQRLAQSIAEMWEQLGRPCDERAVDYALQCALRRRDAHDDERSVLIHGDLHQWNTLQATADGFKLVDPPRRFGC